MRRFEASDRLIVALDVPTVDEALNLADELDGLVSFFKVGLEMIVNGSAWSFIERLEGARFFFDLKLPNDIPETIKRTVALISTVPAIEFLSIGVGASNETIAAAVNGRGERTTPRLLYVAALSSTVVDGELDSFLGSIDDALVAGCGGVVASGDLIEPASICAELCDGAIVVSPGIRPLTESPHDHVMAMTPTQAFQAGADYMVVGRPIRDARSRTERKRVTMKILDEWQRATEDALALDPEPTTEER